MAGKRFWTMMSVSFTCLSSLCCERRNKVREGGRESQARDVRERERARQERERERGRERERRACC
eukprot:1758335-Rhodomonas_salina.1